MADIQLCVYDAGAGKRVGTVSGDQIIDLNYAATAYFTEKKGILNARSLANTTVPTELDRFLEGGNPTLEVAREALAFVQQQKITKTTNGDKITLDALTTRLRVRILPLTKVFCGALAYKSHADIGGKVPYPFPNWFTKTTSTVVGPEDWVILPREHSHPVVYGTELTIVIGKRGKHIAAKDALEYVWGYTILNDVTLRGIAGRPDRPSRKEFDTSAPVGPWIVPKDQVGNPGNLKLTFRINGKQVQEGTTSDLIFSIPEIIAEISKWLTLLPGDIIATGDVGATVPLNPGDIMEAEAEAVGILRNPVKLEE